MSEHFKTLDERLRAGEVPPGSTARRYTGEMQEDTLGAAGADELRRWERTSAGEIQKALRWALGYIEYMDCQPREDDDEDDRIMFARARALTASAPASTPVPPLLDRERAEAFRIDMAEYFARVLSDYETNPRVVKAQARDMSTRVFDSLNALTGEVAALSEEEDDLIHDEQDEAFARGASAPASASEAGERERLYGPLYELLLETVDAARVPGAPREHVAAVCIGDYLDYCLALRAEPLPVEERERRALVEIAEKYSHHSQNTGDCACAGCIARAALRPALPEQKEPKVRGPGPYITGASYSAMCQWGVHYRCVIGCGCGCHIRVYAPTPEVQAPYGGGGMKDALRGEPWRERLRRVLVYLWIGAENPGPPPLYADEAWRTVWFRCPSCGKQETRFRKMKNANKHTHCSRCGLHMVFAGLAAAYPRGDNL